MSELFGRFRLVELIGRGGMGEVYRAVDTVKDRTVAVKRLPSDLAADGEFQARFRREAALAARLDHPHVVPVYDYGEIDGRLYLEMRMVEGTDLASMLDAARALPPARAVHIIVQVAAALDAAHAAGLVHRDVKPSNVLVAPPGRSGAEFSYLADFGIARPVDDGPGTALTSAGATVGTAAYMAPERLRGESGDHRVDVYALACVLFEALTGRRPFTAAGLPALVHAHLTAVAPRVTELRPGLPPALDAVLARGLAKDPGDRYRYAGDLANAAAAALGPARTPWPGPSTGFDAGPDRWQTWTGVPYPTVVPARDPRAAPPRRRRRWIAVIAALAAVAVVATASVLVVPSRDPAVAPPAAAAAPAPAATGTSRIRNFLGTRACELLAPAERVELGLGSASVPDSDEDGYCYWALPSGGTTSAIIDVSMPDFYARSDSVRLTVGGFRAERYFVDDSAGPRRFCVVRFEVEPEAVVEMYGDYFPTSTPESDACGPVTTLAERIAERVR